MSAAWGDVRRSRRQVPVGRLQGYQGIQGREPRWRDLSAARSGACGGGDLRPRGGRQIVSGLVVIGASYAGIQAALSARDAGYAESMTVVADEKSLPYQRPPLSKEFLLGETSEQNLVLRDGAFFASKRIDLLLDRRVVRIDRTGRQVALADGACLDFDKLVIASGSRARRMSVRGAELDGVCYLRSVDDAIDLKA